MMGGKVREKETPRDSGLKIDYARRKLKSIYP